MNDGGPAFPTMDYYDEKPVGSQPGMSLRDHFAGQALAGVLANLSEMTQETRNDVSRFARDCYTIADAMLAERNKR